VKIMKKLAKNKIFQFGLIVLILIFLFSILFPRTRAAGFFRNCFFFFTSDIESFFYRQGLGLRGGFKRLGEIRTLRQERDQLLSDVRRLTEENSRLKEAQYENQVLREQLGLAKKKTGLNLLPAEIIGRDVSGFSDIVLINRGRRDGIKKDNPVVSSQFLVGRIKEVYSRSAKVQFITAVDSVVNAMLQNSRAKGVVKGGIGYGLEMESIPKNTKIERDELVITSGLGETFPKGLIIGQVKEILSDQGDIFRNIRLTTPINFNSLEIVFIVKS